MPRAIVDSSPLRCLCQLPRRRRFRLKRAFTTAVTLIVASLSAALLVDVEGFDGATDPAVFYAVHRPGLST